MKHDDDFKTLSERLGFLPEAREDLRRRLHAAINDGDVVPGACNRAGVTEVEQWLRRVAADRGNRHLLRPSKGGGAGSAPAPPKAPVPTATATEALDAILRGV